MGLQEIFVLTMVVLKTLVFGVVFLIYGLEMQRLKRPSSLDAKLVGCQSLLDGLSDEKCYDLQCPFSQNTRIIRQKYCNFSRQRTAEDCWKRCINDGHGSNRCNAWTYNNKEKSCFLYCSIPVCYNAIAFPDWTTGPAQCQEQ